MMKFCKHILPLLLIVLLTVPALAVGDIDLSKQGAVTISAPVEGMTFNLYLVSTVDRVGELTPETIFSDYAELLDIRGKDDAAWQEAALTLSWFVSRNNVEPTQSRKTDKSLCVSFSGLSLGLYLVTSDKLTEGKQVYETTPFFVLLPDRSQDDSVWEYYLTVEAKVGPTPLKQDLTVKKVWADGAAGTKKYPSITIYLWKDNTIYDKVTLPENGRWWHVWKDLDMSAHWSVTEEPVPGYTSTPSWDGNTCTFTITNSVTPTKPTPTTPTPTTPTKPTPTTPTKPTVLPKTGQLWWPVPVLLCVGAALILVGLSRRKRGRNEP